MTDYCIIMTAFESQDQAQPVIDALIQAKLAACIQCLDISSTYFWDGKVCNEPEKLALIKTRDELFEPVKELLLQMHPYTTPEIIKVPIEAGSEGYLAWINQVTR